MKGCAFPLCLILLPPDDQGELISISPLFSNTQRMPARLQIKAEDCSPLGRFILQYMEEQGISMNRLAESAGVPQPRLRGACFKGTCPTPETLRKLARVMGKHHLELYTLAYEGRIEPRPEDADDVSLDMLMRELFETARELGLTAPKVRPSKVQIRQALMALGFSSEHDQSGKTSLKSAN